MGIRDIFIFLEINLGGYIKYLVYLFISFVITTLIFYGVLSFWNSESDFLGAYSPFGFNVFKIFIWLLLFFLVRSIIDKAINKLFNSKDYYHFVSTDWNKYWIFQGGVKILKNSGILVTDSNSGCLLNQYLWQDFIMEFDLKIKGGKYLSNTLNTGISILFRAHDLGSYFMLQISSKKNNDPTLKIIPHVRMFGKWEVLDTFDSTKNTSDLSSIKVKLVVKRGIASLEIRDLLNYRWLLPTHTEENHVQTNRPKDKENIMETDPKIAQTRSGVVPRIFFGDMPGRIGFRNDKTEFGIVKNLEIKKI